MDIGKFKSIGFIGGGNFGKVFRVLDTLLNVERAIKIIQVKNAQEFIDAINEAQILEKCRHNHIVDIKEIDVYQISGNDFPCITTEYLKNGSAQGYLDKNFVTTKKAIQIITDVLLDWNKHTIREFSTEILSLEISCLQIMDKQNFQTLV